MGRRLDSIIERELMEKDKRIEELLEANNAYLERARKAEAELAGSKVTQKRKSVLQDLAAGGSVNSRADTLNDAIQFAISISTGGIQWLRDWNEGDPRAMRELEQYQAQKRMEDTVIKTVK